MIRRNFMRKWYQSFVVLLIVGSVLTWAQTVNGAMNRTQKGNVDTISQQVRSKISSLQIPFIANLGQMNSEVKFYTQSFGGAFYVTRKGKMVYSLPFAKDQQVDVPNKRGSREGQDRGWVLAEYLIGASTIDPRGAEKARPKVNYFIGKNEDRWKSQVPSFHEIDFGEVYRGIRLRLRAYGDNVEKIFTIDPGSRPETIKVAMEGAQSLDINSRGELEVMTGLGVVKFTKPIAYQERGGQRNFVTVAYRVDKEGYGFDVGAYDEKRPLIVDPLLASTFVGGSGDDWIMGGRRDSANNIYFIGYTTSSDFPTMAGAYDTTYNSSRDIFVTKISSDLSTLLASTFLGGSAFDRAASTTLDGSGNVFVSGFTYSSDFPTTANAYDETHNGGSDKFVAKLDSNLSVLQASTFVGGSGIEKGGGGYDPVANRVVVAGRTDSSDFPTTAGSYDTTYNGGIDIFYLWLTPDLLTGVTPPFTPTVVSPAEESIFTAGPVTLTASDFSDPDGDAHVKSHWLVRRADSVFSRSDYDSSFDLVTTSSLTTHTISGLVSGMKYFWKVGYVDSGSGLTSWSTEYAFKIGTSQADSSVRVPAGTTVADFKMVSLIHWSDDPRVESVLGDEIGGSYDRTRFRIGAYDPTYGGGGYVEYGSNQYEHGMQPGEAGWILAKNGLDITVNGILVSTALDVEAELLYNTGNGNGWNQIASPNSADYLWGNVEVVEYDVDGNILNGPTPISSLSDPNGFIDKRLWRWSNGAYFSDTTWVRKHEGYWVKVKKANLHLRFPVGAQARWSNPGTMMAGLMGALLTPGNAIADDGISPPGPMGDFSSKSNSAARGAYGGGSGGGGSSPGSGGSGGTSGGGAGCFISTVVD